VLAANDIDASEGIRDGMILYRMVPKAGVGIDVRKTAYTDVRTCVCTEVREQELLASHYSQHNVTCACDNSVALELSQPKAEKVVKWNEYDSVQSCGKL